MIADTGVGKGARIPLPWISDRQMMCNRSNVELLMREPRPAHQLP